MKKLQKKLQLLTLVLVAGLLFSSVALNVEAFIQKQGTVNEAVTLRQNADASSSQVLELTNGQQVTVNNELTGTDGKSWYQVFVNDTTIGYVPASTVTLSSGSGNQGSSTTGSGTTITMQTVTVTERIGTVTAASAVRVRAEASTGSDHIASMQPNDTFLVLEDVNASDGYVWYKIELDDNGTTVIGHVRSDLVKVEERTREEQVPVENPATPTPETTTPVEAPYSITSQVNAEGTTVWYLLDSATGDAKEITSLLTPQDTKTGGNGVYKIIVVVLLILVIAAAAAATFFYMRWQDAEMFIYELREQQARARKQPSTTRPAQKPQTKQAPTARPAATASGATVSAKPAQSATVTKPSPSAAGSQLPPLNSDTGKVAAKPAPTQTAPASKPAEQQPAKTVSQPETKAVENAEAKSTEHAAAKIPVQPANKPANKPETKEVLPHTTDIVNATKKELQDKKTAPAANTKSSGWKSKNFLTDDDDLEFDFLDMDEK